MAEYISAFAPNDVPDITYSRVDVEQVAYITRALQRPENQESFTVTFLPVETAEQRCAAAEEWAAYEQAKGQIAARERGAFLIATSRDESPEAFLALLEDADHAPNIPEEAWVTAALVKVIKLRPDADFDDLLREYYEGPKWGSTKIVPPSS